MAVTYPFDLLSGLKCTQQEFDLLWRQEQSRQANGRTIVKDFGSPLWRASYQSVPMYPDELDAWQAKLDAMENGLKTFYGRSLVRLRPIKHPGSSALPAGTLNSIGVDRKTVTIAGLTGITLSVGDLIQIGTKDLHRIVDVASGVYEVRPHIWPGVTVGAAVSIDKPHCIMAIVPGSVTRTGDMGAGIGTIAFQAIEAR